MPAKRLIQQAVAHGTQPYAVCNAQKNRGMPASKMESCVKKVTAKAIRPRGKLKKG